MFMNIKGFKINFLGDSITEGVGVIDKANCRYDKRLRQMCELSKVNNYGVGGSRLAHQKKPSEKPRHDLCFCGRAYDMDKSADMVVVYGGVNDYVHGDAPFGEIGDKTPATYCGGVYFLMKFLTETYAGKPVIFMTPAHCCYSDVDDLYPSPRPIKLPDAKPLLAYVEAIEETAKLFGIPVLNLYRDLGIDTHDRELQAKYTSDGIHFNDDGHAVLAQKLKEFIEAL